MLLAPEGVGIGTNLNLGAWWSARASPGQARATARAAKRISLRMVSSQMCGRRASGGRDWGVEPSGACDPARDATGTRWQRRLWTSRDSGLTGGRLASMMWIL